MVLVEHEVVTTQDAAAALAAVGTLLRELGFRVTAAGDTDLVAAADIKPLRPPAGVIDATVRLQVRFDRGRVSLAAGLAEHRRWLPEHTRLLLALVTAVEARLRDGRTGPESWARAYAEAHAVTGRLRRRHTLAWLALTLAVTAAVVALLVAVARRR